MSSDCINCKFMIFFYSKKWFQSLSISFIYNNTILIRYSYPSYRPIRIQYLLGKSIKEFRSVNLLLIIIIIIIIISISIHILSINKVIFQCNKKVILMSNGVKSNLKKFSLY